MTDSYDRSEDKTPVEKAVPVKKFDIWEDHRNDQEDLLAQALSVSLPGVIDIPQTGTLFEVLSEIPDKALLAKRTAPQRKVSSASPDKKIEAKGNPSGELLTLWPGSTIDDTRPWAKAEDVEVSSKARPARPRYVAESGPRDEDILRSRVEARDDDTPMGAGVDVASGDESDALFAAKTEKDAERAVLSGEISLADAVAAALADAEAAPGAKATPEPETQPGTSEAQPGISEAQPVAAELQSATSSVLEVEESIGVNSESEEFEHPFFELPPLQRSRRKNRKSRRGEGAGLSADGDGSADSVFAFEEEQPSQPELWKILLGILICMLFAIGSYMVGKVFAASPIPENEPAYALPIEENPDEEAPAEAPKGPQILSMLFMGTDERVANEQARADTIILALIDIDTKDIHTISIPRDTRTLIADSNNTTKINHAHAIGGAELMVKTVENLLGINIHYYVETNFKGFEKCIDILGGVDYDVERRMLFIEEGIDLYPGRQKLNGDKALQYIRWRGDPSADIGRISRQQKFIKAFLDQAINLGTVAKLPDLLTELRENVKTDMNAAQMANLAVRFADISELSFSGDTLPGEAKTISGGAYWVMDEAAAKELILNIVSPPEPEPEEGPEPDTQQDLQDAPTEQESVRESEQSPEPEQGHELRQESDEASADAVS